MFGGDAFGTAPFGGSAATVVPELAEGHVEGQGHVVSGFAGSGHTGSSFEGTKED